MYLCALPVSSSSSVTLAASNDSEFLTEQPSPFPKEIQAEGGVAVLHWVEGEEAFYTPPRHEEAGSEQITIILLDGEEAGPFGLVIKDRLAQLNRDAIWQHLPPRLTSEEEALLAGEQLVRFRVQTHAGRRFLVQGGSRVRWGEGEEKWLEEWETTGGPLVSSRQVARPGWQAARVKSIRWDAAGGGVIWDEE